MRRPNSSAIQIAVIGHGCLDLGSVSQLEVLPPPNTLVVAEDFRLALGGPALAAAAALARLQTVPHFYGCLGDDEIALAIIQLMNHQHISTGGITICPGRSSATLIIPRASGRSFYHAPGHNLRLKPELIKPGIFRGMQAALISGIGLLPGLHGANLAELVRRAKNENPRIIVITDTVHCGTGFTSKECIGFIRPALPFIDVFCTSVSEGPLFTGKKDPLQMIAALREMGANKSVVIKRGADGVSFIEDGGDGTIKSAPALEITSEKDGTGAGDGFCAALAAALARKIAFEKAVRIAACAGAKIAENGVGTKGIPSFSRLVKLAKV